MEESSKFGHGAEKKQNRETRLRSLSRAVTAFAFMLHLSAAPCARKGRNKLRRVYRLSHRLGL